MKIFGLQWFKGWTSTARPQPILLAQRAFLFSLVLLLGSAPNAKAQVVINEILPNGSVELKNTGSSMVNVGSYWLCNFPAYQQISNANLECGSMMLAPGALLTVNNFPNFDGTDGEMGLYTVNNYSDPNAIIDYVEWGSTGHQRSPVAVAAMIWSTGDFVPAFAAGSSLEYSGMGDAPSSWTEQTTPTICAENGGGGCMAEGGEITGGPFEFCTGDGTPDNVSGITLSGNMGTNSQWVVTDEQANILGLPPSPEAVDFDVAGGGTCLIWHLSFEDGLEGAEVGMNAGDLVGCFDLSNSIAVVRNNVNGGTIEGGPFEFCVGDGTPDNVSGVTLSGNDGTNSQWVVTDDLGNILGLPPSPEAVDFDGAGGGTCLIWHLSFEDGLEGAEVGMNAADLDGCYNLSNSITVVRNNVNGGTIEGGPFEFCVDDGTPDNVSGITLTGNEGTNSQWVVTDDMGNILGLPAMPSDVDFEGAGAGTCLIWHLSFEDGLEGAAVGNNASQLDGCFNLSNPISVVRLEGDDCNAVPCDAVGGTIAGGPFEFCTGDGTPDNVSGITLTGNVGTNSQWVVTDDQGNILGLPPMPSDVDFDVAGGGTCLIWHLSFEDGLEGAAVGNNASELEGCFDLSNPIEVIRNNVNGGTLEGGPFTFCVDDGIADNVSGVTLTGNEGTNSQWVVTDNQGNILGLPPSAEAVDFEGAGADTCLIWHLSFEDGLEGAAVGNNAAQLDGCFNLSNPIVVVRLTGDDCGTPPCDAVGGTIAGGPFEFCVGDGTPDNVSDVTLTGNVGTNSQWVVTDDQGNILGLPPSPEAVDFDGAGGGTCLIWHLSFEDGLGGAEVGNNASELTGCFSLSNPIEVIRNNVNGGTLEGGPFEFCVGDGTPDNVSGITLIGNEGTNSQWVVTDDQGNILGLPPSPEAVDFDGAGGGTCLIWHLSFEDGLTGAAVGNNASELEGCFNLSNSITVVRNNVNGGTLEGGPFEFCVGDGIPDNVSGITLTGNEGTNSQWVVTDDLGNILGLPPSPDAVDFDGAPAGTCLIWHLSFEDGLGGAEVGNNASELTGCFNLSNPITVVRLTGNDCTTPCDAVGGTIEGGPFEFCTGDGTPDNVSGITLTGNVGTNSQWVVTDDQGNILGLPPMPSAVDFDGAGGGTCLIWHLSFEDGLGGAAVGNNASELTGCFSLSNPIEVIRNNVNGGTIEGGPFEFCVGDGIPDNVSGITLSGNEGTNSQWVVTDDLGNILGLPPSPEAVDFDGAPAGTCLIWHLSFEDGLGGAEVGNNASELTGCFNLSNPIEVIRLSGADCNPGGGDNDYVLVGLDELDIERNFINLGGIGVVSNNGDAEISEDSEVIVDGTFITADEACINSGAMANNVHAIPAQPNLPDFLENDTNAGGDLEVTVSAGETVTLTESIYEDLRIRENATVIFSGQENVYIEDLKSDEGVTFIFDQCTNLILSGRFELGYDNQFNLGEQNVFVFADDDASIRAGSTVYGVVYTDEKLNIRKGTVDRQTYLYGMFIGEDVRSRDYANYWYQQFNPCNSSIVDPSAQNREEAVTETAAAAAKVELSVFPNPANDVTNISINKAVEGDVNVAIYSSTNQLVSTNMKISNDKGDIELNVAQLPAGVYFVKAMLENGEVVTEKLIVSGKR